MSTVQSRHSRPIKATSASVPAFGRNKTSLLERANPGVRRSTPDSDALASSDDEIDHFRPPPPSANPNQLNKQTRRTSWLNEIPQSATRRSSTQQGGSYSPNPSLPPTPAADLSSWHPPSASPNTNGPAGWSSAALPSFPWSSTGIWNENRRDSGARFQVLPSPTSVNVPGSAKDMAIPFSIPLHPTPKTYRSQSYSVGQLEPEATNPPLARSSGNSARGLASNQAGSLGPRPSRPSVLEDLGHGSGMLGRVREVDDDEENEEGPEMTPPYSAAQARTIEQLTHENALLRKAASGRFESPFRKRTESAISVSSGFSNPTAALRQQGILDTAPENGDFAIDDHEDGVAPLETEAPDAFGRISAQLSHAPDRQQNRNIESVKRAQWQTSLGFGSVPDIPQSRRHSFADVPTRQGSIGSAGKTYPQLASNISQTKRADRDEGYGTYSDDTQETLRDPRESTPLAFRMLEQLNLELDHLRTRDYAASYFSGPELNRAPKPGSALHQAYVSPHTYGRSRHLDVHTQPLYIVTFKCCRADVFYIQEGTGLQVKPGELVIVEADRGTDLGTVAHSNVSWDDARQFKEQYAEEHYKWLMLFSRQSQTGGPNATNPNGANAGGVHGSAVGGMGPSSAHGAQDLQAGGDLKPKLIRRLAQNHEIQTLRDKEGNEAKAKRVCQSKVAEHRLNMEILDAEFQMDWKKLTFYYFADAYINFNSLVTDLFKVYKTRIWMSAINPASFVTPTSSLNVPPPFTPIGIGPGDRNNPAGRRRQQGQQHLTHNSAAVFGNATEHPQSSTTFPANIFGNGYFDVHRHANVGGAQQHHGQDIPGRPDATFGPRGVHKPFAPYPGHHYPLLDPNAPSFSASQSSASRPNPGESIPSQEWTTKFQHLTLGQT